MDDDDANERGRRRRRMHDLNKLVRRAKLKHWLRRLEEAEDDDIPDADFKPVLKREEKKDYGDRLASWEDLKRAQGKPVYKLSGEAENYWEKAKALYKRANAIKTDKGSDNIAKEAERLREEFEERLTDEQKSWFTGLDDADQHDRNTAVLQHNLPVPLKHQEKLAPINYRQIAQLETLRAILGIKEPQEERRSAPIDPAAVAALARRLNDS